MISGIWNKAAEAYRKANVAVKASIWFTGCNFLLKGISLITGPLFTRLLPVNEYGLLSTFMSCEQIILTLSTWEIALSAYQKGLFKYKKDSRFFTCATQLFSNMITIFFFGIICMTYPVFFRLTGINVRNTVLLFLYMMLQPAYSCWLVEKRTAYEYKKSVYVTLLYAILNVIVPMTAIFLIGRTAEVKFRYTLLAGIFIFACFYVRNIDYCQLVRRWRTTVQQWKYLLLYQAPLVVHALSYTILAQADRIMIGNYVGYVQAAYYSIAYSLGNIVLIFQNSINQALVPWRFEKLEQKQYKNIRRITNYMLIGIGLIILVFMIIAPEVMKILFTADYYEAVWSVPPIALSVYFMFLYSLFVWVENYYEKTSYVALVSVSCAIINVILNRLLIPYFGYLVCGYTTVISYILFSLGHYYFMKKTCRQFQVPEPIYDIRVILVVSFCMMLMTILITFFYRYIIIRYSLVLSGVIIVFLLRKKILDGLVNNFR